MSTCIRSEVCTFFNHKMHLMPTSSKMFKQNYCHANSENCARNMIFNKLIQGYAPADETLMPKIEREVNNLYPNDFEKAEAVIGWLVK